SDGPRAEVAEAYVTPEIAAEIDRDRVAARQRLRVFRDPVVRLDLRGVARADDAERLEKAVRDRDPIRVREGGRVRVVVADRAVELAADLDVREKLRLSSEAIDKIRELFAERRRRR